jgi:hypothetical protein
MPPAEPAASDLEVVSRQLGRPARDVVAIAARCRCGLPLVVSTSPRLLDGTPFPTFYYVTCPRLNAAISTLESEGMMAVMQQRLSQEPETARAYRAAHEAYLRARAEFGEVWETDGISAGGMPDRVKCLHVLVGQALAMGPGVNPFGDEALAELQRRGIWDRPGRCLEESG